MRITNQSRPIIRGGIETEVKIINDDFRNHKRFFAEGCFVISDPPYNQDYHYGEYKDRVATSEYQEMIEDAFAGYKSVVISYPEETINILPRVLGECDEVISWVYNSNTAKQHRLISWWNCQPDFRKVGQEYKNPRDKRIAERISRGEKARLYDWWEINQVKNVSKKDNPHPCPIPDEVARRIILITTDPGDLIIDPFAGSGTILRMAKLLGRSYIGFEVDKRYFDYAEKSLSEMIPELVSNA